jgi:integrase
MSAQPIPRPAADDSPPREIIPFPAPPANGELTVAAVIQRYCELDLPITVKKRPHERRRVLDLFSAKYGTLPVSTVRRTHLKAFIESNPAWAAPATKSIVNRAIQRAFNWAATEDESIGRNPFKGLRYASHRRRRPVTTVEYERLGGSARGMLRSLFWFLRFTGARPSEARRARWSELRERDGVTFLELTEHKTDRYGNPRVIVLCARIVAELARLRGQYLPGCEPEFIFVNTRGRPWARDGLNTAMRRIRSPAELPADASLYGFRHALATDLSAAGVDDALIGLILGHRRQDVTGRYVHGLPLKRMLEGLDRATAPLTMPGAPIAARPAAPAPTNSTPGLFDGLA